MSQNDQIIGENLKKILKSRNINQKQFAELEGVSYQLINGYLNGAFPIPARRLAQFASDLQCSLEELTSADNKSGIWPATVAGLTIGFLMPTVSAGILGYKFISDLIGGGEKKEFESTDTAMNEFRRKICDILECYEKMNSQQAEVYRNRLLGILSGGLNRSPSELPATQTLESGIMAVQLQMFMTSILANLQSRYSKKEFDTVQDDIKQLSRMVLALGFSSPETADKCLNLAKLLTE